MIYYLLSINYYLLIINYYLLFIISCVLSIIYYLLIIIYYLLFINIESSIKVRTFMGVTSVSPTPGVSR